VAEAFRDKTLIQRHRLVYDAVDDIMHREIHALSIQAKTPDETSNLAPGRQYWRDRCRQHDDRIGNRR
jgi:hypothetical protein